MVVSDGLDHTDEVLGVRGNWARKYAQLVA